MPLDAAQFGLAPADGGGAVSVPQYPIVAPHPPPDNSGGLTNLSDEDYAKFMRGEPPPVSTAKATPSEKPPLDASAFGLVPAQAPQGEQTASSPAALAAAPGGMPGAPAPAQEAPEGFWSKLAGSTAATIDAIPRGVSGNAIDYLNAATQTPIRMATGMQGPLSAFNEGLANEQTIHSTLANRYPIASTGGELMSGAMTGYAAAPALAMGAAPAGASLLTKAGGVADYLGRNAAFGGLMSALSGGSPTTGAAIGGGTAAVAPGIAKLATAPLAAWRQFAPLWSDAARQQSVQQTLARDVAGAPIATSPVGPLDLAQATGSPAVAAKVRYAQGSWSSQAKAMQDAQAGAARGELGQIGAPASAADASAAGVDAIRNLRGLTAKREAELWNNPALTDFAFQTQGVKQAVQSAVNALQRDEPGLLLGMTGDIRKAVGGLAKLPDHANLQNINSYIGTLKAVARRPPPENPRAGVLASRILDSAEKGLDATVSSSAAPSVVRNAYQTARDFTRQRATTFGTQDMGAVLERNPAGLYVADPSEGLRRFFNFSNGSGEGPQNIQQLIEFADQIKSAVLGRGDQVEALGMARNQLRDAARSYVAAALTNAAGLVPGQKFDPKVVQDFLRKNGAWMQTSGLFQRPQIQAAERLMDYTSMLRRTEGLNPQGGSPTQARQEAAKTFIDQIMSPWVRRLLEFGALAAGGHSHGGAGAVVGGLVGASAEAAFHGAESAMRDMMAEAVLDSRVAKDLMMRATPGNEGFLSPRTRDLLSRLRLSIGSDVLPHLAGRQSEPAVAVGQ